MSTAPDALRWAPGALVIALALAMIAHGPITQPAAYHAFADARTSLGVPRAADVLSNIPFAIIGAWALARHRASMSWTVFDASVVLVALGSAYYHLSPDDARLVWDRLPITLVCAALLAAMYEDTALHKPSNARLVALCAAGAASVAWWRATGDLRPYLLLQAAPVFVVPLWQWRGGAPAHARALYGLAIAAEVGAKICEALDRRIFEATAVLSGHTLKHLLAALGIYLVVRSRHGSR